MAVLNGVLSNASEEEVNWANAASWITNEPLLPAASWGVDNDFSILSSTLTNNLPLDQNIRVLSGSLQSMYNAVFYNRILVEPAVIDAGNLISNQVRQITVFNAYFTTKDLNAITTANFDGLTLSSLTLPKTFQPLEEILLDVTIDQNGPAVIQATIDFDFADAGDDRTVEVIGNRIIVFPYRWLSPMRETLEWLTEIIQSYDGTEQRLAKRIAPRQQFEFKVYLGNSEIIRGSNILYGWKQRVWAVPVWSEAKEVSGVLENDTTISVDTTDGSYIVGELAIIIKDDRTFDAIEIVSISANSLVLDLGVSRDYDNSFIMPVRLCRMISDPKRETNAYNGFISANFESIENSEISIDPATQFNSIDVDEYRALLKGDFIPVTVQRPNNYVDFGVGSIDIFDPWEYTRVLKNYRLYFESQAEVWEFRKWLYTRRGKQVEFYSETGENDIVLIQNTGLITTPIVGIENENASQASPRDVIAVVQKDGNRLYRNVDSVSINPSGQVEYDLTTPLNIEASTISHISFMGVHRLASDSLTIEWLSNNVARSDLSAVEIRPS